MDGFDFWAVAGTVSASLCGERFGGCRWPMVCLSHDPCPICPEQQDVSGRPVSDGDRPYRSEQKFFRAGESTRAEGRFYSERPLSLAFLLSGRQKRYVLSVDFAHLSLSINIIALATICNIMKY